MMIVPNPKRILRPKVLRGSIPRIDKTHPNSQGLVGCWLPGIAGGYDLTGINPPLAWSTGNAGTNIGPEGSQMVGPSSAPSSGGCLIGPAAPVLYNWTNVFSVYFRGYLRQSTATFADIFSVRYSNSFSTSPYYVWSLGTVSAALDANGNFGALKWNSSGSLDQNTVWPASHSGLTLGGSRRLSVLASFIVGGTPIAYTTASDANNEVMHGYTNDSMSSAPSAGTLPQITIGSIDNVDIVTCMCWANRSFGLNDAKMVDVDPFGHLIWPGDESFLARLDGTQASAPLVTGWRLSGGDDNVIRRSKPQQDEALAYVAPRTVTVGISGMAWHRAVDNPISLKRIEPPAPAWDPQPIVQQTVGVSGMAWQRPVDNVLSPAKPDVKAASYAPLIASQVYMASGSEEQPLRAPKPDHTPESFLSPFPQIPWMIAGGWDETPLSRAKPSDFGGWSPQPIVQQGVAISGMAWWRSFEHVLSSKRIEPPAPSQDPQPVTQQTVGISGMAWRVQVDNVLRPPKPDASPSSPPIVAPKVLYASGSDDYVLKPPRPSDAGGWSPQPISQQSVGPGGIPWMQQFLNVQLISKIDATPLSIALIASLVQPVGVSGMAWFRPFEQFVLKPKAQSEFGARALFYPFITITPDPRFGSLLLPRTFASTLPARRFASILRLPVPQGPDLGAMDIGETGNAWIDFARWLPTGVSIASIQSVTIANYLTSGSNCAALSGGATLGTAPTSVGGSGSANSAVLQQVTGVSTGQFRLTVEVTTSDGQSLIGWTHGAVLQAS